MAENPDYGKPVLSGLPSNELTLLLESLPSYRIRQIKEWIARGVSSFDEMTNLPLSMRRELAGRFLLRTGRIASRYRDPDGTLKLGIELSDGAKIEAVLLADEAGRKTACLSTQAGCPAGCVFCKTGSLGFLRNLNSAEIVEQFLLLRNLCIQPSPAAPEGNTGASGRGISNIVVMGMGEPLLNITELRRALSVITDKQGPGVSARRITVSTCGIIPGIYDLADNGPAVRLALSLPSADEDLRRRLMPISASCPLGGLKKALAYFRQKGGGRITLEAALLSGINTRRVDAAALADFAKGLDVVINLIPWNPVPGLEFEGRPLSEPSGDELERFRKMIEAEGLKVTRRYRKGRGVMGACGQLGGALKSGRTRTEKI
ncbi:MAG: 23S rRNA (adenine(2503)-C(2))-methyltransferase RlmN [Treponema sp.]|jgi:23S rRNA (adenine2503-C2)-methyltransferase|nr:23S rRNA (adenine(2503)-C(2))-methyltransferase RlmN [Treponema sp.]